MTTNRVVLVDNATLSGVERLLGESKTLNLNYIDNDIACFEKLITAILFSDEIIGIDDYKEQYRSERSKRFNFIRFVRPDPSTYSVISKDSAEFAASMMFSLDGSKPAGDVVSFFDALRIDPQLRWDVFTSSEYLTMSFLVKDAKDTRYETSIDSVLRNEGADASAVIAGDTFTPLISVEGRPEISDVKQLVQAFAAGNPNFSGTGSWTILQRCIFGYGWAAERSHFYNAVAAQEGADAFLAPLRDAFCESCCRLESKSQTNSLLEALKSRSQDAFTKIVAASGRARFAIKLPFFTAYLISTCDNPRQCIDRALELRGQSDFRDCRTIFHNLSHLTTQDKYSEVNRILGLLDQSCSSLLKKFGISTPSGPQVSLSLGISGVSIGTGIKLDKLFSYYRNRPFTRVFRNISQEMLNIERLGELHDKMLSSLRKHQDATHLKVAATPKFMENRDNEYGRPAEL
jgi:hypothetical protein